MHEPWQRMDRVRLLRNPIREYAWGSHTALAELLGAPSPSAQPQAELWMGAHPQAPSRVCADSEVPTLSDWIARDADAVLGAEVARRFGGELPFLLKVLAAERPLSLQTHPDAKRAREGFERENAAGVAVDASNRSYRDPNPKPELVCALTRFSALCGFRPIDDIVAQVDELRSRRLAAAMIELRSSRDRAALRRFYATLLGLPSDEARALVDEAVEATESGYGDPAVRGWIRKLAAAYPGDLGVLTPLFLNLIELGPGEALFLPAGRLHAYLGGTAIEIMANSDNVLRAGLTSKHVDVPELLATLTFDAGIVEVLKPRAAGSGEDVYDTPAGEFELSVLRPAPECVPDRRAPRSVEILFCAEGEASIETETGHGATAVARGQAALVPAAAGPYRLTGRATVYRARVPQNWK
jgi:mannose-6-phosphate isomerase